MARGRQEPTRVRLRSSLPGPWTGVWCDEASPWGNQAGAGAKGTAMVTRTRIRTALYTRLRLWTRRYGALISCADPWSSKFQPTPHLTDMLTKTHIVVTRHQPLSHAVGVILPAFDLRSTSRSATPKRSTARGRYLCRSNGQVMIG